MIRTVEASSVAFWVSRLDYEEGVTESQGEPLLSHSLCTCHTPAWSRARPGSEGMVWGEAGPVLA